MGLYHKVYKISDETNVYSSLSVTKWNDFVSETGNPLFFKVNGGVYNIYELINNTEISFYAELPLDPDGNNYSSSDILTFKQCNNYIFTNDGLKVTYSVDYGKNWNTFYNSSVPALVVNGTTIPIHQYNNAFCLNNTIGIIEKARTTGALADYYVSVIYTEDFINWKRGFVYSSQDTLSVTAININDNTICFQDSFTENGIRYHGIISFTSFDEYSQN